MSKGGAELGQRAEREIDDAVSRLASAGELLVALDFDGTLAPLIDDPANSRALPESHAAVLELASAPHTRVAYVSGRALESLERVADVPDSVLLVGSHGAEFRLDGADGHPPLSEDDTSALERMKQALDAVADAAPGVWIEVKPAGFAVHTRRLDDRHAERVVAEVMRVIDGGFPGATVRAGKDVLEMSVLSATKGDGIARLRDYTGADAVFYAGDDVTDEDAFAALDQRDIGVKVGSGETRAQYRIDGPREFALFLGRVAESRIARLGSV
ncbi:trehalose-phosphatase [Okibacterium endophyticum]